MGRAGSQLGIYAIMSGGFWSYKFQGTKVAKFDNQNKHDCRK